jgi:hypothetical protein
MDRQTLRNKLASIPTGGSEEHGETLAVLLCQHFDKHPECPDQEVEEGFGWREWAVERQDEVLAAMVEIASEFSEQEAADLKAENERLTEENERIRMSNLDCTRWEKATRFDLMRCQQFMVQQRKIIEKVVEHTEESQSSDIQELVAEARQSLAMQPSMDMVGHIKGERPSHDTRAIPHGWEVTKSDCDDLVLDEIGRGRRVKVLAREMDPAHDDLLSVVGAFLEDLRTFNQLHRKPGNLCQEQKAFESVADELGYSLEQHPLHYLFLDKETSKARKLWKAAIEFCLNGKS